MGLNKIKIKEMIKTVEKKSADRIKIREIKIRKEKITADLTLFFKGNKPVLIRKVYSKDVLCGLYGSEVNKGVNNLNYQMY